MTKPTITLTPEYNRIAATPSYALYVHPTTFHNILCSVRKSPVKTWKYTPIAEWVCAGLSSDGEATVPAGFIRELVLGKERPPRRAGMDEEAPRPATARGAIAGDAFRWRMPRLVRQEAEQMPTAPAPTEPPAPNVVIRANVEHADGQAHINQGWIFNTAAQALDQARVPNHDAEVPRAQQIIADILRRPE